MNNYSLIKSLTTTELIVKRIGFLHPTYELTDGQYNYGILRNEGTFKPRVFIETGEDTWLITGNGWRNTDIKNIEGETIGYTSTDFWSQKITFTAIDGFTATFVKPSFWKSISVWQATDGSEILSIRARAFNTPVITFTAQFKQNRWILMLAFLALEIHLKRQMHAVAAAT